MKLYMALQMIPLFSDRAIFTANEVYLVHFTSYKIARNLIWYIQ